jgi:hypothetical protein
MWLYSYGSNYLRCSVVPDSQLINSATLIHSNQNQESVMLALGPPPRVSSFSLNELFAISPDGRKAEVHRIVQASQIVFIDIGWILVNIYFLIGHDQKCDALKNYQIKFAV